LGGKPAYKGRLRKGRSRRQTCHSIASSETKASPPEVEVHVRCDWRPLPHKPRPFCRPCCWLHRNGGTGGDW